MVQGPLFCFPLCQFNYAKFFCMLTGLSFWFCLSILRNFGECCESVPLDRSGSYISISIKQCIYITRILAHVVQVDASLLCISKLVTSAL